MDASTDPPSATATPAAAWTCGACGHANDGAALCERCGVSRAWLQNRPLDLPPRPGWFERPAGWLALLHAGLAAFGVLLLVRPEVAPYLALRPWWQAGQVALSASAAWAALNQMATLRLFRAVELVAPDRCAVSDPIEVTARIVPYRRTHGVHVELALLSRTFGDPRGGGLGFEVSDYGVQMRSRTVGRFRMASGGTLRGRRASLYQASFDAPFPSADHHAPLADLEASLLGAVAWLVPGAGERARNLREHGGIWVRLRVRVGLWRRVVERRVFVYHLDGDDIHFA